MSGHGRVWKLLRFHAKFNKKPGSDQSVVLPAASHRKCQITWGTFSGCFVLNFATEKPNTKSQRWLMNAKFRSQKISNNKIWQRRMRKAHHGIIMSHKSSCWFVWLSHIILTLTVLILQSVVFTQLLIQSTIFLFHDGEIAASKQIKNQIESSKAAKFPQVDLKNNNKSVNGKIANVFCCLIIVRVAKKSIVNILGGKLYRRCGEKEKEEEIQGRTTWKFVVIDCNRIIWFETLTDYVSICFMFPFRED